MEFAIQTHGRYEDVLEVARFSERRGLPAIALPDHYLMALDEEAAGVTRFYIQGGYDPDRTPELLDAIDV